MIVCGAAPTLHPLLCTIESVASTIKKRLLLGLGREIESDPPNQVEALTIGRIRVRVGGAGMSKKSLTKSENESEIQSSTWTSC
jgi:hypothetical protein